MSGPSVSYNAGDIHATLEGRRIDELKLGDLQKGHVSPSQINLWSDCHRKWWYDYVDRPGRPPVSVMFLGSRVHAALEYGDLEMTVGGRPRPEADKLAAYYGDTFAMMLVQEQQRAGLGMLWKNGDTAPKLLDVGVKMIRLYERKFAPALRPVAAEEKWTLKDGGGSGIHMLGRIDVVDASGWIVDRKTGARAFGPMAAWQDKARIPYSLGAVELHREGKIVLPGGRPQGYKLQQLVRNSAGDVKEIEREAAPPTDEEIGAYLTDVSEIVTLMRTGLYPRVNQWQTCSWCSYLKLCQPALAAASGAEMAVE